MNQAVTAITPSKKPVHKPTTALYLRISLDDDNQDASNSVVNQQDLLSAYVAADSILSAGEVLIFADDDGWSGTNFERPQVKALLDLVRRGAVQNIVVKDLSRWGRNYPEVSEYFDQIFPSLGVRFISVNDQYDSNDHKGQTAPMGVVFSSIVHDIYSKELSVKVKQAHVSKAKKGEYVVGTVPYGFIRPKEKDNRLVIDEAAAIVIRRLFNMASEGMQNTKIVATLNAEGIDSPLEHRRNGRSTLALRPKAGRSFWDGHMLYRILGDERYTGTLVYAKTKKVSHNATSGKKREVKLPESEWIRVPRALPAIISAELFERVNERRCKNKRGSQSSERNTQPRSPFVGKVVCGHCGQKLSLSQTRNPFFRCPSVKRNTGLGCYGGMVRVNDLSEVLLATAKLEAQKALELMEQRQSQKQAHSPVLAEKDSASSELKRLTANIALLEQHGMALYEAFAEGKVDRESMSRQRLETAQIWKPHRTASPN